MDVIKSIYVPSEQRNSQISEERYKSMQKTVMEGCYMMLKSFLTIPNSDIQVVSSNVLRNRLIKLSRMEIIKVFNSEGKHLFENLRCQPIFAQVPEDK